MKRFNFLSSMLAAGVAVLSPIQGFTRSVTRKRSNGFQVKAGKDRDDKPIKPFAGDTFFTKVSTADSEGDLYIYESERLTEGGPGLHLHFEQDEWWYVLEGSFRVKMGEEIFELSKGDSAFGPRMIPHTFEKMGEGPGRLLMVFQPAGQMQDFFEKTASGYTKTLTPEQLEKFRTEHGVKQVGPPLSKPKTIAGS